MRTGFINSFAIIAMASGCTTIEGARPDIATRPLPSRLDEIAYINILRSAFVQVPPPGNGVKGETAIDPELCFDGLGIKPFRAKSGQGYHDTKNREDRFIDEKDERFPDQKAGGGRCIIYRSVDPDSEKEKLRTYLAAGFGLTDLYCQRFFTVSNEAEQNRKFGRSVFNGVDVLMSSILTLSGAGKTAIGITNSGFGLIDTTFQAYDTAYLVAPDMSNVRKLIQAAQNEYRQNSLKYDDDKNKSAFPKDYGSARAVIERYAGLCTFSGMRELVNASLKDKTDKIDGGLDQNKSRKDDAGKGKPGAAATPPKEDDVNPGVTEIRQTAVPPSG